MDIQLGNRSFNVDLLFEDTFENLDNWAVESNGSVQLADGWLEWNCDKGKFGTMWCKQPFDGPTLVEYDAVCIKGNDNLNFISYAQVQPEGLLETTQTRTGKYNEYHVFQNYIMTYVTNFEPQWRVRFRKNPGFDLLNETFLDLTQEKGIEQHLGYVFDANGRMALFRDGNLLLDYVDTAPYRSGYHGFRTWYSVLKYANFKVYAIVDEQEAQ